MATAPKKLLDIATRHSVYLERLKVGNIRDYKKLLKQMEREVLGRLAGQNVTDWSRARLNKELAAIRGALTDLKKGVVEIMRGQIEKLATYEAGYEARALAQIVKYDFDLPSDDQLRSALYSQPLQVQGPYQGALLGTFLEDLGDRVVLRFDNAIRLGYVRGETTQQIVRNIVNVGGTMDLSRRDIEYVVRTSLAHSAATSREAVWNRNSDLVKAVRWVSTLDDRTSQECRSLDGQEFPVDSGPRPPIHINCRSTTVAVLDDRFRVLEKGGTRTARGEDGEVETVPAKQTYYGWLQEQPAAFQDSVLGPTRGKLLRDGGLSAERFAELQLGKRFEPLTLEQMRKLEPVAFERAGL